jgi:hypothetical protein
LEPKGFDSSGGLWIIRRSEFMKVCLKKGDLTCDMGAVHWKRSVGQIHRQVSDDIEQEVSSQNSPIFGLDVSRSDSWTTNFSDEEMDFYIREF